MVSVQILVQAGLGQPYALGVAHSTGVSRLGVFWRISDHALVGRRHVCYVRDCTVTADAILGVVNVRYEFVPDEDLLPCLVQRAAKRDSSLIRARQDAMRVPGD
jgi:hypothetical protein